MSKATKPGSRVSEIEIAGGVRSEGRRTDACFQGVADDEGCAAGVPFAAEWWEGEFLSFWEAAV